jgi:predicted PurR-regulated permease PerM
MLDSSPRRNLPRLDLAPARRNRLILVFALLLLLLALLWAARGALAPYILGLALAYLLIPLVRLLDKGLQRLTRGWRGSRIIAVLLTYLLVILVMALFFLMVVPVIAQQFRVLWDSREALIEDGEVLTDRFLGWYDETVPVDIQTQIQTNIREALGSIGRALQSGVIRTFGVVTNVVSTVVGFIVIPFWLFYILSDESTFLRRAVGMLPERMRPDVVNVMRIADGILGKYLRGQLILCVIVGVMATVGLTLLGVRFPAVLGLIAGVFEILPFVGPIIGLVPAVIVATIQQPILGLWTLFLFLGIQQLENVILVPRISGKAVEVHPALIMVVLVIGNQVAGLWGMILAVPVTAIIRDVFKYLYLRFQEQPLEPRVALQQVSKTPLQLEV